MKKRMLSGVAAMFFSANCFAAVACSGTVQTLAFNPGSGIIEVSIGYGVWYLCNVTQSYNGVDPATCKVWYATLLGAKIAGKTVNMIFDTTNTCTQMGNWAVPSPMPYWTEVLN